MEINMPCTDVNISHIPASYFNNSSHKINNSVMTNLTLALIVKMGKSQTQHAYYLFLFIFLFIFFFKLRLGLLLPHTEH